MYAMLLWALLGGEARAEDVAVEAAEEGPSLTPESALRRRNGGIALTAIGGGILGTGLGLMISGAVDASSSPTITTTTTTTPTTGTNAGIPVQNQQVESDNGESLANTLTVAGGVLVGAMSIPFLASGIPLWISGSERLHETRVTAVPTAGGGQLRFTASF